MHYKNGREAKNGDQVVMIENGRTALSGILHSATPGNNTCNGSLRQVNGVDHYANLSECLHAEDIAKATIPDSTKAEPVPGDTAGPIVK